MIDEKKITDTLDEANGFIVNKRPAPPVHYSTGEKFDTSPGTEDPIDFISITDSENSSDESESDENDTENENIQNSAEVSSQSVSEIYTTEWNICFLFCAAYFIITLPLTFTTLDGCKHLRQR